MGITTSNPQDKVDGAVGVPHEENIRKLFQDLCSDNIFCQKKFEEYFVSPSLIVTKNLFERFFIDLLNGNNVTKKLFVERIHWILQTALKSKDEQLTFYMDLMVENKKTLDNEVIRRIIIECAKFGILQEKEETLLQKSEDLESTEVCKKCDRKLADSVINSFGSYPGETKRDQFLCWCKQNYAEIFSGLQSWLHYKFTGVHLKNVIEMLPVPRECEANETQLNTSLLWFLCCVLPSCYTTLENRFRVSESEEGDGHEKKYTWNLLYDSNQHGLSLNRFKHKVLSYKSPTVTIVSFKCGLQLVMGLDQAWEDSPDKFGGPYCVLIEVSPLLQIIEENSTMFYLKENGRSIPTGLVIGSETRPKLTISKDFQTAQINYKQLFQEEVQIMEVWGCGGVEAIRSQADMKKWEQKEIEKRKKVKLPGQWDQDKTILEMGGVTVNHSQRGDM